MARTVVLSLIISQKLDRRSLPPLTCLDSRVNSIPWLHRKIENKFKVLTLSKPEPNYSMTHDLKLLEVNHLVLISVAKQQIFRIENEDC